MQEPQPATAPTAPYGYPQPVPGPYQGAMNYGFQPQPMGVPGGFVVPPVQNQPPMDGTIWMPIPPAIPNCPPGLEYLTQIDQVLIHQQLELLETLCGLETNNKYEIKNSLGQRVYFAEEDDSCCYRDCYGSSRPFTIRLTDSLGHEVITLHRPDRCSSCCCPCCLEELEVQAPPGTVVGYVVQNWHACLPKFTIQDAKKMDILKILGPCTTECSCCEDVNFEVKSLDETLSVGMITKQWTGIMKELDKDADNFGISFPMDLDVKMKAVMIGACFLIQFMFFGHASELARYTSGVW
ncbi:phospholipid scramblase 1-like [Malurus melanocephalus]|uniref:phospholipid scramblase 1-like n=1 Tax=Malurus melanocephalus TaxID=175006 RepID=UPI0025467B69|nr:phospholipid scramblase 1-like [Malurus melanocephalus]